MLPAGLFTDVGVRVMDKSARLNVTIGIDMQIVAATSLIQPFTNFASF